MHPFNIIKLPEATSTQVYITENDKKSSFGEFTVIYTDCQTHGKGQGTHLWESEPHKNISFSFILKPSFIAAQDQFIISQFVSLAIADAVGFYVKQGVKIKWPNDIYVNQDKICGFLVQNQIMGNDIYKSYIGIGLNVNQRKFDHAPNPTSLSLQTGAEYPLEDVLDLLLEKIYMRYMQLKSGSRKALVDEYLSMLLFKGQRRQYICSGKKIYATIESVNSFGHVIYRTDDAKEASCELRQWQFIL